MASALSGGSTLHADVHSDHGRTAVGASNAWLGMLLFIVSEAVMFAAFFAQYFYNRALAPAWPNPVGLPDGFTRVPVAPLPLILTAILALSAYTAHNAQTAIRKGDQDSLQGWLVATVVLGASFIGGQVLEYVNLIFRDGFTPASGIYGTTFYSLTGLHGIHVTAGVIVLFAITLRAFMGHFSARNHFAVEGAIMYWHFVDLVWVALLAAVYFF